MGAFWPPFGVFLSCLGLRRSVSPSLARLRRHSRRNRRGAKRTVSRKTSRDDRVQGPGDRWIKATRQAPLKNSAASLHQRSEGEYAFIHEHRSAFRVCGQTERILCLARPATGLDLCPVQSRGASPRRTGRGVVAERLAYLWERQIPYISIRIGSLSYIWITHGPLWFAHQRPGAARYPQTADVDGFSHHSLACRACPTHAFPGGRSSGASTEWPRDPDRPAG